MAHTIKSTIRGKKKVEYFCERCGADLNSPLEEAGRPCTCPACQHEQVIPGGAELRQQRAEEQAKVAADAKAVAAKAAADRARSDQVANDAGAREATKVRDAAVRPAAAIPAYKDILTGAGMIRFFAGCASVVGILSIIGAVIVGFGAFGHERDDNGVGGAMAIGLKTSLPLLGSAFVAFVTAVSLKMYAALALALRDIAQNTFRN